MAYKDAAKNKEYNAAYWRQNKEKIQSKAKPNKQRYYRSNILYFKARNYKNKYGLTPEETKQILEEQNHQCKLCSKDLTTLPEKQVHLDHDHTTGKIRGFLCMPCNVGLGMMGDSIEGLQRAMDYLKDNS